jgi:hypothetical protein
MNACLVKVPGGTVIVGGGIGVWVEVGLGASVKVGVALGVRVAVRVAVGRAASVCAMAVATMLGEGWQPARKRTSASKRILRTFINASKRKIPTMNYIN